MKISVLLAALLLLFSCTDKDSKQSQDLIVKTAQAVSASGIKTTEFPFIAQPFRTSELSFRVGGPIDRLDVYAGNHYKQGSIIAEIDPRDFHIRKERTEAIYHQAKAVKPAQPVISFIDINRLKIEIYVTQNIAFASHPTDSVRIYFDAQPDKCYKAQIVEVSKGTTRNNLSYLLTAVLPNKEGKLLAGMSGKAIFDAPVSTDLTSVSIPQTALCYRPSEGEYVWVIDTNTRQVNRRTVKKGNLLPGGYVTITEGLRASETVATSGLRFLSDGMKVEISTKTNSL